MTVSLLQNASGFLLQNATVLLQNGTVITRCDDFITKCGSYYKMRRLFQIATVHTLTLRNRYVLKMENEILNIISHIKNVSKKKLLMKELNQS